MKVQIYSLTTIDDALAVARLGADLIGVVVADPGTVPEALRPAAARSILEAVAPDVKGVALSLAARREDVVRMVEAVRPDIVHLAALELTPDDAAWIRGRIAPVGLMRAIAVSGERAILTAAAYQDAADYLLLDSKASEAGFAGATGRTHDWRVSRRITDRSRVPVVLAGGLSPDNVAVAISAVRPWGVDSFTHTDIPGQRGRKDLSAVRGFIEGARDAAAALDEDRG